MSEIKKTPLCAEHEALGARMVEFAGWYMPVLYQGIGDEHKTVRENVGLFDVSHMGEIFVRGPKAIETLQWLTTNDVSKLSAGEAQYSLLPNEAGGIVDDIIIYCLKKDEEYLVCVNASNIEKDFQWMKAHNKGADISNESSRWGQIAVQGPKAMTLLSRIFGDSVNAVRPFQVKRYDYRGTHVLFARTGYTGEDGAEVFVPSEVSVSLWRELLEKGADLGVKAIGLGARDTLRLEMKYSLYGHEITDETNPIEAKLGWVVKLEKGDFLGRGPIAKAKQDGASRALVGIKLLEKGIAREGYPLISFDKFQIGRVTSGTVSPSLNESIAVAYVDKAFAKEGSEFAVDIRGRMVRARVVKTPFVKTSLSK